MAFNILIERISIFLKFEIFSKIYCVSIYESMSFLKLGIELLDSLQRHKNDSEVIYTTIFSNIYSLQLIFFSKFFLFIFDLMDLQGPINIFQVLQI